MACVAFLFLVAIGCISFLIIAGLSYLVCWGFGLVWSWPLAVGVWASFVIIRWAIFGANN